MFFLADTKYLRTTNGYESVMQTGLQNHMIIMQFENKMHADIIISYNPRADTT